jgi:hypothetical protein
MQNILSSIYSPFVVNFPFLTKGSWYLWSPCCSVSMSLRFQALNTTWCEYYAVEAISLSYF